MPEITLPPTHNNRAPTQWDIITPHVDFRGKTVLDLGCGYADLLWRCWAAGADSIKGIDHNSDVWLRNCSWRDKLRVNDYPGRAFFWNINIPDFIAEMPEGGDPDDVILCFSVLPYLNDFMGTLEWICEHSRLAFIECQYFGDGPGPAFISNDYQMEVMLVSTGWRQDNITPIGTTYIPDRDRHRTIWLCENKEVL